MSKEDRQKKLPGWAGSLALLVVGFASIASHRPGGRLGDTKTKTCPVGVTPENLPDHTRWKTLGVSPVPDIYRRARVIWECREILKLEPPKRTMKLGGPFYSRPQTKNNSPQEDD